MKYEIEECTSNDWWQERGYKNRQDYLRTMAEDYGVPLGHVLAVADLLGEGEDFDGLISTLEDVGEW